MTTVTDPSRKGFLTSEFQILVANSAISYGALIKIAEDLSKQDSFLIKHPTVAMFVSGALIISVALQSLSYTFGRSKVKSAIVGTTSNNAG